MIESFDIDELKRDVDTLETVLDESKELLFKMLSRPGVRTVELQQRIISSERLLAELKNIMNVDTHLLN